MKLLQNVIMKVLLVVGLMLPSAMLAQEEPMASGEKADTSASPSSQEESVDVKSIVFGHIGDSYEWHITDWGDTHITIPLPVIVYSQTTGWHVFMSSRLEENGGTYQGLSIAPAGSKYEGKLVEHDAQGNEVRPFDISITKVVAALLINSALLLLIVLGVARWYRKHPKCDEAAPGGFVGFMEMFIMMINDDVIKSCVGPNYRKFAPYLLTAFFFALMQLVPASWPLWARLGVNTVLIALFVAHTVHYDFPLSALPVVGKYFRRKGGR